MMMMGIFQFHRETGNAGPDEVTSDGYLTGKFLL
jgi:hypothetical protein